MCIRDRDRTLQWKEPATGVKKTGHRSGTKERIGEKHKEKDVILKKHEHSIWSVSYTHLDVYKRQGLYVGAA